MGVGEARHVGLPAVSWLLLGWLSSAGCAGDGTGGSDSGPDSSDQRPADVLDVTAPDDVTSLLDTPAEAAPGPPPRIEILSPDPGTYASGCGTAFPVRVRIESPGAPLAEVAVAGQVLDAREGEQEVVASLVPGLNVIEAVARTVSGAWSEEHRAILCGEYRAPSEAVAHAADLYLGREALTVIGRAAARFVDAADLGGIARAMNPLYRSSLVTVTAEDVTLSPGTEVTLKPAWGLIVLGLVVRDLDVRVVVSLLDQPSTTWPVRIATARLSAEGMVTLDVPPSGGRGGRQGRPDGGVSVGLAGMTLDLGDPTVTVEGLADDLLAVFPEYRETIIQTVEGFLAGFLEEQVTRAVGAAFERLADPVSVEVLDRAFDLRFFPSEAKVTPDGVRLGLDVGITGLDAVPSHDSPGVLATPGQEEWPMVQGVRISLKDDLLNVVFHEAWRSGLLEFTVDQAFLDTHKVEVDLVAGFLGGVLALLPGPPVDPETRIAVDLRAAFPPVASLDLPASGGVRLGAGDLGMEVRRDGRPDQNPLLAMTVTVRLDGEVVPSDGWGAGPAVKVILHALDVAVDVADPDGTFAGVEAHLEETTSGLIQAIGPTVSGLLGSIPLPSFGGFAVTGLHVGTDRADGGVLFVTGDLVEVGP